MRYSIGFAPKLEVRISAGGRCVCRYCINIAQFVSLVGSSQVTRFFGEFCQYGGYTSECIKFLSYTELRGLLALRQTRAHAEALFVALETAEVGTQARRTDSNSRFT